MRVSWLPSLFLLVSVAPLAARGQGSPDTTRARAPVRDTVPRAVRDTIPRPAVDSARSPADSVPPAADSALNVQLRSRLEAKGERIRNERCSSSQLFNSSFSCRGTFQPQFDFQFNLLTGGTVGERVHVDVDYDTQREFDASNNISIYYQGKDADVVRRVEIGNVSFALPPSRFITSGIPAGNYGIQALGSIGSMQFRAIAAQQKGNMVKDQVFTIGDRTLQQVERDLEDWQIEPRRFFFTVDPRLFGARYPDIDLLDAREMASLAAALPDTVRPSRIFLYRLLIGGQPPNPNGPQFRLNGDPTSRRGQVYELLRENVDYYIDPSLLWVALVRPLSLANERLVVAYTVRLNGRDTTIASTGGTPDLELVPGKDQVANLIWDPLVTPSHPAFIREIRSVYRIGGEDVRRESVQVRIVTGASGDQEKPPAGDAESYLQLFGLAEPSNPSTFDIVNRLWPRSSDPNVAAGGALGGLIIKDQFLIFPSLEPFSRRGLAQPLGVPANDTIYRTPSEFLYSQQHPQSFYRIRARFDSDGGSGEGAIALNSVQIRQGSERVIIDGRPLIRGDDYTVDYELGRVTFTRPDLLFASPKRVIVRYEENPLFASVPTSIYGLATLIPFESGQVGFTAISQTQRTTFTRPPLGFEPAASLVAGVNGAFAWNASALSRGLERLLPFVDSAGPSRIELLGEFAMSRPRSNTNGQAFIESFEGEGGTTVNLADAQWYYGSQPAAGSRLLPRFGADVLDLSRATTLAWQNLGTDANDRVVQYTIEQIDPLTNLVGTGFQAPEQLLWMTLYPLRTGGLYNAARRAHEWQVANTPAGRRWRSIRTLLGSAGGGADLTRVEHIEFWSLIDTSPAGRARNPVMVLDFGDVSENSVAFAPETLTVAGTDSIFAGKRIQGFDVLDTERDPFSRAFNVDLNDRGLPGDLAVEGLRVLGSAPPTTVDSFPTCLRGDIRLRNLGDARANCTVRNNRLDEEDIDQDNVLNFPSAQRDDERIRRYIIDMSDERLYDRVGRCPAPVNDINGAQAEAGTLCWVHFRIPFNAADDSTGGGPLMRRVRALRLTMISGAGAADDDFTMVPIARLRLVGAPWLKRADRPVRGIAGEEVGNGYVIASMIGTQDSSATLVYQSPPGVSDEPDQRQTSLGAQRIQINERSLRLLAGGLEKYDRAEAYFRFPEGQKSFMSYKEMRLWARGRNNGWGSNGELQFYVKIGRDANNFYLYRTTANSGDTRAAWDPEVRVRFERFFALRAKLEKSYLQGSADSISCTGVDSALIVRSGLPLGTTVRRYAACADGYMVYSVDPTVSPPNLAAVQELAVGMVRVADPSGMTPTMPGDTLELWVDDIRLSDIVNEVGFAGQVGMSVSAGDIASIRFNMSRRDPNFRQLAESPTFVTGDDLEISSTVRLDRLLPNRIGVALPLTITHTSTGADPLFLSRSDVRGAGIPGLRTPKTSITTYALSVRRATPLTGSLLAPIVNNLALTGTFTSAGNRSEFQKGAANNFRVGIDYIVTSSADAAAPGIAPSPPGGLVGILPDWGPFRALREQGIRFSPTQFRLSSAMVRNTDRRASFLKPASAIDDSAQVVTGLENVWRNGTSFELKPVRALAARWSMTSVRDLRDYGSATPNGIVASSERDRVIGVDVGLERERLMDAAISFTPSVTAWLTPRLDIGTSYTMYRDPNARTLALTGDSVGDARLPRRLGNAQTLTAAATLDLAKALAPMVGDSSIVRRAIAALLPIDVTFNRSVLSAFDGAPFTPGLGYQLGIGGVNGFRKVDGRLATSAGLTHQLSISNTLALPFNISVANRYQKIDNRNWTRRLRDVHSVLDGDQVVYPDLSVRWSARPALLSAILSSVGATARMLHTRQSTIAPTDLVGGRAEERTTRVKSYPVSASAVWAPGNISTSAGYSYSTRVDSLPGSVGTGRSTELNGDIAKAFALPEGWQIRNQLRTRLAFQLSETESYVSNEQAVGRRSRLTDNGRHSVSLSADTDLAENMSFSLQGARVVSFDRNFNRRFTQMVFTAALQLEFFAGATR